MKIKELIGKVTEAWHGAMKGGRLPRSIVFDSTVDLSQALLRAKDAHSDFERALGATDYNWPLWYASYMAKEQGLAEKSLSTHAAPASEVSPGSENAAPLRVTRRGTIISRMLRYLFVTATLFYYSRNIASTSIRTLLGFF